MIDFADRAAEFWSANARSALETAKNSKQEQALADSVVTKVSSAVKALTVEIKERRPSTPAELNAHIDAIDSRKSAVVESVDALRRAISTTQLLESSFSTELGASVDAVRAKLGASCTGYLTSLRQISREWQRFSGDATGATNDKVATVRQELAQLDVRKAGVAGDATSNGERLIREAETKYKQAIETIDASAASTYASKPYQYWAILVCLAAGGAIAAAFLGAAELGRILVAVIVTGVGWIVVRGLDRSIERAHAERKEALRAQAEAARSEGIRRVSREQEEFVRSEIERIGEDARKLQRKLDEAISNLAEGRERAQQTARDLAAQERSKLEQSWGPLACVTTEVTQLFQLRHAKAIETAGQVLRERLRNGMRKCQAEVDTAVDNEIKEPSSKCKVGSRDVSAPSELQPYLERGQLIRVPLVIDLMDSCYLKHDPSLESLDAARRLASWHAMEIWRRTGGARVTIFDLAGLGSGYGELLSIGTDEDDVTLLAATRDVIERLSELVRTAAARNRALAASGDRDWMTRRTKTSSVSEPAEVLLLEVPRSGLGSEQRAQIEALLGVGPSAGVTLIVLDAKDRKDDHGMPSGMAREVVLLGSTALEKGYSLEIPGRDELARKARAILDVAADKKLSSATQGTPAGPPSSSFAEFIGAVVPGATRWQSDLANTDENISIPIGVMDNGDVANLVFDDGAPHALLLGGTGSGKTNFLHTLIQAGCLKFSPDELRLYLADLKNGVSFEPYARLDRLGSHFGAVACTSSVVFGAVLVDAVKREMQRRYDVFKQVQRRQGERIQGLADYRKLANPSDEKLPRLLVIIDEFQALFDDATRRRQTGADLVTLLKQGRQAGVHVMLATQSLRGKASDLDEALSQIHTRMMLKAAISDASSIYRSMPLAQQAVAYCGDVPGRCFVARDFGEKDGCGSTNPKNTDDRFFFNALESLTIDSPPPDHLVPIVWSDEVGSLRDNYQFRFTRGSKLPWFLGVPYSADHALVLPLPDGVTVAAVTVEDRGQARALVASLLMSLYGSSNGLDVYWVEPERNEGPLRRRDFELMERDLELEEVRCLYSLKSLASAFSNSDDAGKGRLQVAIVPDVTRLSGERRETGSTSGIRGAKAILESVQRRDDSSPSAGSLADHSDLNVSSDLDLLVSIASHHTGVSKVVVLLATSCDDLRNDPTKSMVELAGIRIASGRSRGLGAREFLRVSDLPQMADDDLVVTNEESRRPMTFRPFEEKWSQ